MCLRPESTISPRIVSSQHTMERYEIHSGPERGQHIWRVVPDPAACGHNVPGEHVGDLGAVRPSGRVGCVRAGSGVQWLREAAGLRTSARRQSARSAKNPTVRPE